MATSSLVPKSLQQFLSDYGMVLVLLGLCVFFSVVTLSEQSPVGEGAAEQLQSKMAASLRAAGDATRTRNVLIVARDLVEDRAMVESLKLRLKEDGMVVVGASVGEPRDARAEVEKLVAAGIKLDFVACTEVTGSWILITDLVKDFPALGAPEIVVPTSYRWPNFLKRDNLLNIANQIAVIAIVAVGMTMVIITGGIDLSVGSLIALAAVLAARFIRDYAGGVEATWVGMAISCVAAIACCGVVGGFSALMITRFAIPPFIVTLAMMLVCSGMAYILSEGQSIYAIPDSFVQFGRGADIFGVPNAVLLMLVLYVVAHGMMSRMKLGRHIYAVGGNQRAAILSGVPVNRILWISYVTCASLAGLGGVLLTSQLKSGSPTYGNMYELYVIAAVVVGGTSLSGGEGRMFGTLVGAFTIAVIQNGMNLTNVESYTQKVALGCVLLGAVLVDKLRHRS